MRKRSGTIIVLLLVLQMGAARAVSGQGPTPASPSPLASPTPIRVVASPVPVGKPFVDGTNAAGSLATAVLQWLGVGFLILLLAVVLPQLWQSWKRRHLVIEKFSNASGDSSIDPILEGFTQLLRERFMSLMRENAEWVQEKLPTSGTGRREIDSFPPPEGVSDTTIKTLTDTLKDAVPAPIKPAVQLIGALPQRGTRITGMLQRRVTIPDTAGYLGISLVIADMEGRTQSTLGTIWQLPSAFAAPVHAQHSSTVASDAVPAAPSTHPLFTIGMALAAAWRYSDAVTFFTEALESDRAFTPAADALAAATAALQNQQSGIAAYAVGKALQDAGMTAAAVESYLLALPPENRHDARIAWCIGLKLTPGDPKGAYLTLARLYGQGSVALVDQSLVCYQLAAEGAGEAVQERAKRVQALATTLTRAAEGLYELARYTSAEKYLGMALTYVPDHAYARAVGAKIKQSNPVTDNTEALALYTIGKTYEDQGALELAMPQYVSALTKQPTYVDAQEGLARVFASRQTLASRYRALIDPIGTWLSLTLIEAQIMREGNSLRSRLRIGLRSFNAKRYHATVRNFFGQFYLAIALDPEGKTPQFFLGEAKRAFGDAIDRNATWYAPHENLATVYYYEHRYRDALDEFHQAESQLGSVDVLHREAVARRLSVEIIATQLQTQDLYTAQAITALHAVEQGWVGPMKEQDNQMLYSIAACYALADSLEPNPEAKQKAREYLLCTLARSDEYQVLAESDPDLTSVRNSGDLACVTKELRNYPQLSKAKDAEIVDAITHIMEKLGW